jgi:hypothetical protein
MTAAVTIPHLALRKPYYCTTRVKSVVCLMLAEPAAKEPVTVNV